MDPYTQLQARAAERMGKKKENGWPCMLKAYVPSKPQGLQRALLGNGWQQLQTLGCS